MNNTTILFLNSYLSKDKFADALTWVKARPRRLWLPDQKVWAYDTQTLPSDPAWDNVLQEVADAGWKVVGETLWNSDLDLKANQKVLEGLAELATLREEQSNQRRHAHRSGGRTW